MSGWGGQHAQRHRQRRLPNVDESSLFSSGSRRSSCSADSSDDDGSIFTKLNKLQVKCPNCAHRFPLSESLLMADPAEDEAAAVAGSGTAAAPDVAPMMEAATDFDGPCDNAECVENDFSSAGDETLLQVAPGSGQFDPNSDAAAAAAAVVDAGGEAAPSEEAKTSQPLSRCFQILNWTVEQLEKVICDPNDRRIRKISSITQCDIEVRSEMAQSRFGAPKNFCILRAGQLLNIEQCRSLLERQLLWVMKPRAQDCELTR